MRGDPNIRQWKILRLICGRRYMTAPQLADALGCSIKSIYRDLRVLEIAGFPLQIGPPHDNYVRLDRDWFLVTEPAMRRA